MKTKGFRITFNAPVTLGFVFAALAVMLLGKLTGGASTQLLFMTYRHSFLSPLTWLRLLTHVLGHSGWEHFAGNISYVLLLGPMLEEKYGSERLLEVICITAVVTGLINFLFFPHTALCGASGVVFAFILLTSFTSFRAGEIPLTFVLVAAVFIGQQVAEGLLVRDNVSNLSHIVGGLIGAAVGYTFNRRGSS
ncbi:MAG: rhomboid family intramembrane serine protease [Eubacteriales bacterium]|nr:rhomboid family intramembrane serine protease [Sarcina sp.]MBR2730329.1 rhomboid family intramembrane serine protease [Lachnospiraceae bacterium]MDO4417314.1 rhomboid family intramembrane serine protease [Eubacteriales bacterium]